MTNANKTYDLKTAAHLFSIGEHEFYKILRGESEKHPLVKCWINKGRNKHDPKRNTPFQWTRAAGYLLTEQRGRIAPYNKQVQLPYWVTVITRLGISALEKQLGLTSSLPPMAMPLNEQNAFAIQQQQPNTTAEKEREKCLQELAAIGIPTSKAS